MNSKRTTYQRSFLTAGRRAVLAGVLAGALTLGMAGCASTTPQAGETGQSAAQSQQVPDQPQSGEGAVSSDALRANVAGMDFEYSDRDLAGTYDATAAVKVDLTAGTVAGEGASFDAATGVLTVSQEGTYLLSGTLAQGQVVVEADHDTAKVQLVLDGASISNATGPAIWVKSADKVFVTTAESTQNSLSSGDDFALKEGEDEPDATIFSKENLTLNGKGSLAIEGNYKNGVTSKDDLVIGGGTFVVTAADHGLKGKDCVKMAGGTVTVTAGGDGVKSTNDEDTARGFVSIDGGTLTVDAGDDGIDAQWYFRVMDGTVNVTSADDAFHSESDGLIGGGTITVDAGDDAFHCEYELVVDSGTIDVQSCVEGYEAQQVIVNGGTSNLVASDDAINAAVAEAYTGDAETTTASASANGDVQSAVPQNGEENGQNTDGAQGGKGNRGQRPQDGRMPEGGFQGEEGQPPEMPEGGFGGDDGQMPEGGQAPQGGDFGGRGGMGGGMADVSEDCLIQINGGTIYIEAGGDGLDSNGNIELNGGVVYVSGPTNSGNGAIDYELNATSNGGTIIAAGPAGMAAGFTGGSTPFAMVNASGNGGQTIAVVGANGQVLASMEAQNPFQNVVIASPDFTEGETVSIVVGGTVSGTDAQGIGGTVSGGSSVEATVSTTATQGGMGGPGGMGGGRGIRG